MKSLLIILFFFIALSSTFATDILILESQQRFEGKVTKIKKCNVVFKVKGEKYIIPASDIKSLIFEESYSKVCAEYLEIEGDEALNCLKGKLDAQHLHGKKPVHFLLGILFGPFSIIGTLASNPTPNRGEKTIYESDNKELFDDPYYLKCYKKKVKSQLIGMEALGWLAWVLGVFIVTG